MGTADLQPNGGDRPEPPLPPDHPERRKQRERALRMHNAGMPKTDIADITGIPYGRVKEELVRAMRDLADEPVEYKAMGQMSVLRDLRRALYTKAMDGDVKAIDRLLRVLDHEAKLLGMYAPTRVQALIGGGGVSEHEFAVVVEALLQRAGRDVPRHIAVAASDARRAGISAAPVVVDGEAS